NLFIKVCLSLLFLLFSSWRLFNPYTVNPDYIQQCLRRCFDADSESTSLKKFEISVTNEGFIRLRKYFPNGKQEYLAFNLKRLSDMYFIGSSERGTLILITQRNDIIVQTYNDPKGNIDSMTTILRLPLKNIDTDELNYINNYLNLLKADK